MGGGLNDLRRRAAELLERYGVETVQGMESAARRRLDGPVAAVSVAGVACVPGGFQDYLGTERDGATGGERELYGREAELTMALDIYAPRDGGEELCQQTASLLCQAVLLEGLGGLTAERLTAGRVEFLERDGLYRLPVTCLCRGWLVARQDDVGEFTDFEVRGNAI